MFALFFSDFLIAGSITIACAFLFYLLFSLRKECQVAGKKEGASEFSVTWGKVSPRLNRALILLGIVCFLGVGYMTISFFAPGEFFPCIAVKFIPPNSAVISTDVRTGIVLSIKKIDSDYYFRGNQDLFGLDKKILTYPAPCSLKGNIVYESGDGSNLAEEYELVIGPDDLFDFFGQSGAGVFFRGLYAKEVKDYFPKFLDRALGKEVVEVLLKNRVTNPKDITQQRIFSQAMREALDPKIKKMGCALRSAVFKLKS